MTHPQTVAPAGAAHNGQNRSYRLGATKNNSWTVFLRDQAQSERTFRKALRHELPEKFVKRTHPQAPTR